MSQLRVLDETVSTKLHAQPHILSYTSAVNELLQNSIDAKASTIYIVCDFLHGDILCKDNGCGIPHEDLNRLGRQNYLTSKISRLDDLTKLNSYGFKGIALYSMAQLSKEIHVVSKCPGYGSTWVTTLNSDEPCRMISNETKEWVPDDILNKAFTLKNMTLNEHGTTILIHNLFYNMPVRKKVASGEPLFKISHQLKADLFQIVLRNPNITVTIDYLQNGKQRNIINYSSPNLQLNASNYYVQLVRDVFNPIIPDNVMKNVSINFKNIILKGIISTYPLRTKDLQFIFINGRKYHDPVFVKLINSHFLSSGWPGSNNVVHDDYSSSITMGKNARWFPFYTLDVTSPLGVDDFLQDPNKIIIRPHMEKVVHKLILKVFSSFLNLQGYSVNMDTQSLVKSPKKKSNSDNIPFYSLNNISSEFNHLTVANPIHTESYDGYLLSKKISDMMLKRKNRSNLLLTIPTSKRVKLGNNTWLDIKRINEDKMNKLTYKITKDHLLNCDVIGQIDKKFILTKFSKPSTTTLLIFDQHACDERVKLEFYIQCYINDITDNTLLLQNLLKPLEIRINDNEFQLFSHYKDEFRKWGIEYCVTEEVSTLDNGQTGIRNKSKDTLKITALSDFIFEKYNGNKIFIKNVLLQHIEDLKCSKKIPIQKRLNNEKKHQPWYKFVNSIPQFLIDCFNSKACRSAIMFGDKLSKLECEVLINNLTKCVLPFQCAHGRPSIIPLTIINGRQEAGISENTNTENYEPTDIAIDYSIK